MKKILITLSSLTTLTIAGNSIINNPSPVNSLKLKTQNTPTSTKTSLFNYQYGILRIDPNKPSENTWIANQSIKDHKIYSYNLQPVIGGTLSDGTKMENVFIVDENGNLDYNREIPTIDKPTLDNSKTEMIEHRKVTTINDNDNIYSCSKYVAAGHFADQTGTNTWQYLQQGQAEPNIDISHKKNTSNIENNDNESEALGLYYIAKQSRAKINRIDLAVADELAEYFISKSSLNTVLNNKAALIDQIITLMNKNDNVFNFIANMPFTIESTHKNYTMNYIFDNRNHLIAIYYQKWNNIDNLSVNTNDSAMAIAGDDGNYGYDSWCSNITTITNWKKYANSWNDFITIYPTFGFSLNSYLQVYNNKSGIAKLTTLSDKTSVIKNKQPLDLNVIDNAYQYDWDSSDYYKFCVEKDYTDDGRSWSQMMSAIYLWHDDQNIYYQFSAVLAVHIVASQGNNYEYKLDNCTFNNIMN